MVIVTMIQYQILKKFIIMIVKHDFLVRALLCSVLTLFETDLERTRTVRMENIKETRPKRGRVAIAAIFRTLS